MLTSRHVGVPRSDCTETYLTGTLQASRYPAHQAAPEQAWHVTITNDYHMRQVSGQRVLPAWALLEAAAAAGRLLLSDGADGAVALQSASLGPALALPAADSAPGCGFALHISARWGSSRADRLGVPGEVLLRATSSCANAWAPASIAGAQTLGGEPHADVTLSAVWLLQLLASTSAAAAAARTAALLASSACTACVPPAARQWPAPAAGEALLALQTVADAAPGHPSSLAPALALSACAACVFHWPSSLLGAAEAGHAALRPDLGAQWAHVPCARASLQGDSGAGLLEACGVAARRGGARAQRCDDPLLGSALTTMWQGIPLPRAVSAARYAAAAVLQSFWAKEAVTQTCNLAGMLLGCNNISYIQHQHCGLCVIEFSSKRYADKGSHARAFAYALLCIFELSD